MRSVPPHFGHFPVLFIKFTSDQLLFYNVFFPSALAFAHLALAAAEIAALPALLIRLLPLLAAFNLAERIFRAFLRALISLRL